MLPDRSVEVQFTVLGPMAKSVPDAGVQVTGRVRDAAVVVGGGGGVGHRRPARGAHRVDA